MRNLSIDYLKVFLAFIVILLHLNFLNDKWPELSYVLVNGLFRLAVPLFLIVTGYYFYNINNFDNFKKWLLRIGGMYAIWMIIYFPFWFEFNKLLNSIVVLFFGYFVLWYLVGVLFSGTILYFLRNIRANTLLFIALTLYVIGYCLQQLGNLHVFTGLVDKILNWHPISRNFIFDCFTFLTLGFLIKKLNFDLKYKPSLILVLISILMVIFESRLNYIYISKSEPLDHILSMLFAAPLIFLYVKNLKVMGENKNLALFSTAVFLIHPLYILLYSFPYEYGLLQIGLPIEIFVITLSALSAIVLVVLNKKLKYIL
ncbi:acyltransferase [Acinetobacter pittii]|uniref:acyltransferase family protein n=1 Tax=Acinetobacter pittii TaxID=48296 RepID=UPI00355C6EED